MARRAAMSCDCVTRWRHAAYCASGTANAASSVALARAAFSPSGMVSGTRSKSAVVMSPISTSMRTSPGRMVCSCSVSLASIITSMVRLRSCVAVRSRFGSTEGSTRFTTMTRSAHNSRATSMGMFRTSPPSLRMYGSMITGANAPGIAMLARIAVARSPSLSTTIWPVTMSVATARYGIGNLSNWSCMRAVAT